MRRFLEPCCGSFDVQDASMLLELTVKNFALIDSLNLSFSPGFNVITGETGAGKSIIVGAIGLLLGGRASSEMIRLGSDEAEVQALFSIDDPSTMGPRLQSMGLPDDENIAIRRLISRSGRNRIYINGALSTLNQLNLLGRDLMAVSSQHEHQQLLDPDRQLLLLDQYAGLMVERDEMTHAYEALCASEAELERLARQIKDARDKTDLFEHQREEILAADLKPGEDEEIERERDLVRNSEKIFNLVRDGYDRLYGESGAVIESLAAIRSDMERAARMDQRLKAALDQVEDAYHQLDDVAGILRGHLQSVTFDPAYLESLEDRLALINKLKRKYGSTITDILQHGDSAGRRLDAIEDMERRLADMEKEVSKREGYAKGLSRKLSDRRRIEGRKLADALTCELRSLGMPHVKAEIAIEPLDGRPGPLGKDRVEYRIAPNLGEELMPLAKIASGGELSRTTLAIKSLLAGQDRVQTIVFDEVDAGIGGAVAEVVGRKLNTLSDFHQLLCITHLPQIAAFASGHHQVYKEVRKDRTVTRIRALTADEKLVEIARMLSGTDKPTPTAQAAAREMIERSAGRPNDRLF